MRILSILALASLILALNAQPMNDARELFEFHATEFHFSSELKSQGFQCITNLQARLNSAFGHNSNEAVSVEAFLFYGIGSMSFSEAFPCISAVTNFMKYWKVETQYANVNGNFERNSEEIFRILGISLSSTSHATHLSRSVINFFHISALLLGFSDSSVPSQPIPIPRIPKIAPEEFYEEFFAGFFGNALYITNKTVINSVSQCAIEVTYLLKHAEEGTHDLAEDIIKALTECSSMKKIVKDFVRRNRVPRREDARTSAKIIAADFLMNNAIYKRMLRRSFEDVAQGNYNFAGRRIGNFLGNSLRTLVPLQNEML